MSIISGLIILSPHYLSLAKEGFPDALLDGRRQMADMQNIVMVSLLSYNVFRESPAVLSCFVGGMNNCFAPNARIKLC